MEFIELIQLCKGGETSTVEFKTSTRELRGAFETVCGFLNAGGGSVVIGAANNGELRGQEVSDQTRLDVAKEARKLEPISHVQTEWINVPGTDRTAIVLIAVPSGDLVPYTYDGRAFQRLENATIRMSQQRYQELLLRRTQSHSRWETGTAIGYGVDDLDRDEILRTVRLGIETGRLPEDESRNPADLLARLGLVLDNQLTNAAVVLFGREMLPRLPQCTARMAQFRGIDKSEFLDNRQVTGNAFVMLNECVLFLRRHLPVAGRIQPGLFEREDEPHFPLAALREALVNAITHRDYSAAGGAISLAIYDDRLEIWNDGSLPPGLTVDDLKRNHPSRPPNPLIANVMYKRGLVESWGRGTQKIVELCVRAGHPEPEFVEEAGSVGVRFLPRGYIPPHRVAYNLSLQQREILQLLSRGEPLALREIAKRVGGGVHRSSVQQDLRHLRGLGLVEQRGYARGSVWLIVEPNRSRGGPAVDVF
jgi:ATP-dependent DNA helicase RecG